VSDEDAIIATVTDYWEGWFSGDAARMERALHPALTKTGALTEAGAPTDDAAPRLTPPMTAANMISWTAAGEGVAEKPADAAFEVVVGDVYGGIATVTVRSAVYREYLHLARTPTGWRIVNALYTRS
jgi:hypothetical protein